jgi:hypothetical protein
MGITIQIIRLGPRSWTFTASDSSSEEPIFSRAKEMLEWIESRYTLPAYSAEEVRDVLNQDLG